MTTPIKPPVRSSSASLNAVQDDGGAATGTTAASGHDPKSTFGVAKEKAQAVGKIFSGAKKTIEGVETLAGGGATGAEGAEAAREESVNLDSTAVALTATAAGLHQAAVATVKVAKGEEGVKKFDAKTKGVGKAIEISRSAAEAMDSSASTVDRLRAGVETAQAIKDAIPSGVKVTAGAVTTLATAGRALGVAGGAMNVSTNVKEGVENYQKWKAGDSKAGLDLVNNAVQVANNSVRVVEDTVRGAQALGVLSEGTKLLKYATAAGPLLKAVPIVGAAIGTGKAVMDAVENPSLSNLAKVGAQALGFIPGPAGAIAAAVATAAVDKYKDKIDAAGAKMADNFKKLQAAPVEMAMPII